MKSNVSSVSGTKSRATAMAIHQTANYTGVVVSGFVAAWIGERYGWHAAFYSFGLAGIVLALVMIFRLRNDRQDRTGKFDTPPAADAP
ncbi:MAG: MFS transporter [Opitutaceae bacterium]